MSATVMSFSVALPSGTSREAASSSLGTSTPLILAQAAFLVFAMLSDQLSPLLSWV
ncbi:hypothetical protein [Streptomyces sp. NPDC027717]|uniref:hypothetical protein n=1 Tax=Streptomyces sp. NPDC027717 TaxID=3155765 RepID=UPI0033D7B938